MSNLYTNLGSGLKVSKVVVGCMSFGDPAFFPDNVISDEKEVFAILKECYDRGLRTFDTANIYSGGKSEVLLGKFLREYKIPREKVVICTKLFGFVEDKYTISESHKREEADKVNRQGLSRKHVFDAVSASVERLGTYIDLLQIHRYDHETPPAETMRALNDVVESGKVLYLGASSMKCYEFHRLQNIAERNGWHKFISMQSYYNLLYREDERELIPFCKEENIGLIPWSPLARGSLAKPLSATSSRVEKQQFATDTLGIDLSDASTRQIIERVEEVAKAKGASMAAVATAWVIHRGAMPIVGVNSTERVADLVAAIHLALTDKDLAYLEEPYKPQLNHIL